MVFSIVRNQLIFDPRSGLPVDIDINSVWKTIEKMEIDNPMKCFEKVMTLSRHFINLYIEKARLRK